VHEAAAGSGKYVCVYNKTRERCVATRAKVADGYFSRLVGLLGTTRHWVRPGNGLWIVPSHGVHTIGMLYALDLIFLDRHLTVVSVEEHLRPCRISKLSFHAHSVLELPIHTVSRTETRVGDQLEISRVHAPDPEVSA
jgi:uncharacterized membrane protein (UPF0127 family)